MGYTIAEKILKSHCSAGTVEKGNLIIVDVDFLMASDTTAPIAITAFREMNGVKVFDPGKVAFVIDHASPCPNRTIANLHKMMRSFANEQDIYLYDAGEGVCHQLMYENGHITEGSLILGADSHTCTYGAVGSFATGVGATDLAAVMLTGKTWLKVPETIRINLKGNFEKSVYAKDLILHITGMIGANGATYKVLEFGVDQGTDITTDDKLTISNMAIEMGAKAGIFQTNRLVPDHNAEYERVIEIDLSTIQPMVSAPHTVDNVFPLSKYEGLPIDQVFIGSCTNGRLSDLQVAAGILKGKRISKNVRLIVAPASKKVLQQAAETGVLDILLKAGATLITPGCGPCVGTLGGIPADRERVLSTSNRNFLGRMGNNTAEIFLCSPAVAAVSALTGRITNPAKGQVV
jgi:3-isopropylmalate/(R)-2-methylmalate dehydratase large subunit